MKKKIFVSIALLALLAACDDHYDDQFNINTILNADKQREALIKMAEDYIYLNPPDHQRWLSSVVSAIANLGEDA